MNDPYVKLAVKVRKAMGPLDARSRRYFEANLALHSLVWRIWSLEAENSRLRAGSRS